MKRTNSTSLRIVDTNVPIEANLAARQDVMPNNLSSESAQRILSCIAALIAVMKNNALVIDSKNEIFDEYRKHLSFKGQPGVGDVFLKWIHDNRWGWPEENRVAIHPDGKGSYKEFPTHGGLVDFDPSDRKFIAVANAHIEKPPILQATDSKWWGWKEALAESGVRVEFLCPHYVKSKYEKKCL